MPNKIASSWLYWGAGCCSEPLRDIVDTTGNYVAIHQCSVKWPAYWCWCRLWAATTLATGKVYIAKSSGPSMLPYGTPDRQLTDTERTSNKPTYCMRSAKNDHSQLSALWPMPNSSDVINQDIMVNCVFLSSLRGDVAISAEASSGPNAQPHIPNGLKSLRGFCKPQKSTPVHLT